jgi:DNA-directed RNA polymerase specialized sigma24 family protein
MEEKQSTFEELCLPHLDAAYSLARLLVRKDEDAQDLVQEAYVRAWKAGPASACAKNLAGARHTEIQDEL